MMLKIPPPSVLLEMGEAINTLQRTIIDLLDTSKEFTHELNQKYPYNVMQEIEKQYHKISSL